MHPEPSVTRGDPAYPAATGSTPRHGNLRHAEPVVINPIQRRGVMLLLVALMGSAIGLGIFLTDAIRQTGSSASTLLTDGVPALHHAAELEQALLLHQLVVNRFTGNMLPPDRFTTIETKSRRDIAIQIANLQREYGQSPQFIEVRHAYDEFNKRTSEYLQLASREPRDTYELTAANERLAKASIPLRDLLERLQSAAELEVTRSGDETEIQLNNLFRLVGWFTAATGAISIFMIYHVRARLRSEKQLAQAARCDPLTMLPHRTALERQLGAPGPRDYVLVLCGVDRFEEVTGSLGHASGDKLMCALANRFEHGSIRLGGLAFRMDGASFALLFAEDETQQPLLQRVQLLRADFQAPFDVGGQEIFVTLSMGSVRTSKHGRSPAALLRRADLARHAARKLGGDNWVDFHEELEAAISDRLAMDADMRHAIDRAELVLHYQPQQHLDTGRLKGFEALLRWQRGDRLISPVAFIPLAEETGLIVPVGDWVLREACRQVKTWNSAGRALTMSVNISVCQLQQRDFVAQVRSIFEETGVEPTWIELEVTESVAMQDPERIGRVLKALCDIGVSIAMDDFGTGYSSLSYLRRLPLRTLKLDRSFIQAMPLAGHRDGDIVDSVIKLAHGMRLNVVAEGVETRVQLDRLRELGCDEIQGYVYGHPMTATAATGFISSSTSQEWPPNSLSPRNAP